MTLHSSLRRLLRAAARTARQLDRTVRASATHTLAWEHRELENLFALLALLPLSGVAAPSTLLALDLLPYLERELLVFLDRARTADDPMGELFSTFDVT